MKKNALHSNKLQHNRNSNYFSGLYRFRKGGRRYSPFTTNVERLIPWRTITGRQSFYLDHDMMKEFGETMATFKPILQHKPFRKSRPEVEGKEITLNYLTPHNKWSIHSMYFDSLPMLTLFRGGPTV